MKKQKPTPTPTNHPEKTKEQRRSDVSELREQMGPWLSCPPVVDPWEDGHLTRK